MEQKLINSNWENKIEVKKGNIGEDIVEKYIEKLGYIIYKPVTEKAHPFDRLCVKNKIDIFVAEIKTKPKRTYYPDTGFNHNHYEDYKRIQKKGIKVYIFFVDEDSGDIYGNWLSELSEQKKIKHNNKIIEYPLIQNNIIYFPIISMKKITNLDNEQSLNIKKLYSGSYK
jgi:hypothetical protein